MSALNLSGCRFGQWTVIGPAAKTCRKIRWLCRCDCGAERSLIAATLTGGLSKSCGCTRYGPPAPRGTPRVGRAPTDRTRDRILEMLMDGPSTVSELASVLEAPVKRIDVAVTRLAAEGLLHVVDQVRSMYGRRERLFGLARTRKAA